MSTHVDADTWEAGLDPHDPERRGDPQASALELAAEGLPVFRCWWWTGSACACLDGPTCDSAGKHPFATGWQAEATTDERRIAALWTTTPPASPAIATGEVVTVLDLDLAKPGGPEALQLCEERGLPPTWTVATQSGGRHYYFRPDPRVTACAVGIVPSLDVRDRGGLVVAPQALGARGRYRWLKGGPGSGVTIAAQPEWLVAVRLGFLHRGRRPQARRPRPQATATGRCGQFRARGFARGQRNDGLFKLACAMAGKQVAEAEIEALVLESAALCDPPLPEHEARRIVASATRYA